MPKDLDNLQGAWKVISLEADGQSMPPTVINDARIIITGDKFESLGMGAVYEGVVEIDETAEPRAFDLLFTKGHATGHRDRGIYKLKGDTWTLCLATRGDGRPKEFLTAPDTGLALEILEREDVSGKSPTSESTTKAATINSESTKTPDQESVSTGPATELEGEWNMVSAVFDGLPMSKEMISWAKRITTGNVTKVMAGPQVMLHVSFTVDDSVEPKLIDYVNLSGANNGKSQAGIYGLKGDSLSVCMSPPGRPRPTDFSSVKR